MQAVNVFASVNFFGFTIESQARNFGVMYLRLYLISVLLPYPNEFCNTGHLSMIPRGLLTYKADCQANQGIHCLQKCQQATTK